MLGKKNATEAPQSAEKATLKLIQEAKFPLTEKGYDCRTVDKFLERLSSELSNQPGPVEIQLDDGQEITELTEALAESETHARELEGYADALEAKLASLEEENQRIKRDAESVILALQGR